MKLSREQVAEHLSHGESPRDLSGTDLTGLDLSRMDLRGANLSRADLSAADLRWALLEGADLHSSVLRRADCRWAVMRGANLRQADLGRANLSWADVTNADLTGAQMDGANLENVDLSDGYTDRGFGGGRARSLGGGVGPLALPRSRAVVAVWAIAVIGLAVQAWGWLYRRAFLGEFGIADETLTRFTSSENFAAGLSVGLLTVKTLLVTPFVLALLAALTVALVVVPAALVWFGDRVLKGTVSSQLRAPVTVGLFGAFFLLAWAILIPALRHAGSWLLNRALPAEAGLRSAFTLATRDNLLALGFLLMVAAAAYLVVLGWRLASIEMARRDIPARWRIRYPRLNEAYAALRASKVASRNEPLTTEERRNGFGALAALALLLPVLLAFTGRVDAYHAMCDGGDLPRVQLFTKRVPETPPPTSVICSRLVAQTEAFVWVYFPSETRRIAFSDTALTTPITPTVTIDSPGTTPATLDGAAPVTVPASVLPDDPRDYRHTATVYKVARGDIVASYTAESAGEQCATCADGPTGDERYLIDPDELLIGGIVDEVTAGLVTLSEPTTNVAAFQIRPETQVLLDGVASDATEVRPGRTVRAIGTLDTEGNLLLARQVTVLSTASPTIEPSVDVTFNPNELSFIVSGTDWRPGSGVRVGLALAGERTIQQPLGSADGIVTVAPDGTFSAPMAYQPLYPTGPEWRVLVIDDELDIAVAAPWFAQPPPTPVPTSTPPPAPTEPPFETVEATPPESEATNTPLVAVRAPGGMFDCEPDEFEADNGRHQAKEIYVGFAEDAAAQARNFCPVGDLDLAFFRVKSGRWYRVYTQGLAPGVDTVIQVGDLSPNTPCQPGGCWNDDKAALTYSSEVIFQAVEDATALITVDNFGTGYGTDATYELGVVEFQPEATPTVTPFPSGTPTPTPRASVTPKPASDPCDDGLVQNNTCANACLLGLDPYFGTINRSTDQDYFKTVALAVGLYRIVLEPPEDRDYDLQLYGGGTPCPGPHVQTSRLSGDAPEYIEFNVDVDASVFYVRVYPSDPDQVDIHNQYLLQLSSATAATSTALPTFTPTFTPAPTSTATPTLSVRVP